MKLKFTIIAVSLCAILYAQENKNNQKTSSIEVSDNETFKWSGRRPDGHAPISVMGDHIHRKGDWMLSYKFMNMYMRDLRLEYNDITNQEAHDKGYMITPLEMSMNMHMLGIMYAPSNKITLMLMANIISNDMDLQMRNMMTQMIMTFSTSSSGFGDVKILGLYKLFNKNSRAMHAQLGFSIPTGSINNKDVTPMSNGNDVILPYPMQIGSGTFDTDLALTYLGQRKSISWGHQLKGIIRLGENDNDYRLGNQYSIDNWLAFKAANWLSFSGRLKGCIISEIVGANPDLNPMMVTTADTDNSGGSYINSGFGFNTYVPNGKLKGFRFGFEYSIPLYQKVNGIQLKQKQSFMFGLQYAIH